MYAHQTEQRAVEGKGHARQMVVQKMKERQLEHIGYSDEAFKGGEQKVIKGWGGGLTAGQCRPCEKP